MMKTKGGYEDTPGGMGSGPSIKKRSKMEDWARYKIAVAVYNYMTNIQDMVDNRGTRPEARKKSNFPQSKSIIEMSDISLNSTGHVKREKVKKKKPTP